MHLGDDRAPIALGPGDLVVFPHDAWHVVAGRPTLEALAPEREADAPAGPSTTMLCGWFEFEERARNPVLASLPEMLLVRAESGGARVEALARVLLAEAEHVDPGAQRMLDRLAEALFVTVVRAWVSEVDEPRGLLAALTDHRLSRAFTAMHRQPEHVWTAETLAARAGMLRTAFATACRPLVGESPLQYLTEVRIRRADILLERPSSTVPGVAEAVGYGTETAFRRAYNRVTGAGPAEMRQAARRRAAGAPSAMAEPA